MAEESVQTQDKKQKQKKFLMAAIAEILHPARRSWNRTAATQIELVKMQ